MSTLSVNTIKDVQSFDFANTSFASAFGVANSGYVVANAAFGVANTAIQNTSGSFNGSLAFPTNANLSIGSATTGRVIITAPSGDGIFKASGDGTNYAGLGFISAAYGYTGTVSGTNLPFHIFQNGTARLTANVGGYIGIATTTPIVPFHVRFGANSNVGFFTNTYPAVGAFNDTFSEWKDFQVGPSVYFKNNGAVGVGTSTPGYLLDVGGAGATGVYSRLGGMHIITANTGYEWWTGTYSTAAGPWQLTYRKISDGTWSIPLHIETNGNVGIGTTTPSTKLYVYGGSITSGTQSSTSGSMLLQGVYGAGSLTNIGTEFSSGGPVIGYAVTPSLSAAGSFLSSTTITIPRNAIILNGGEIRFYQGASQNVAIGSAVTMSETMRIDSSGNVGIGTTSPSSYGKLTIFHSGTVYNWIRNDAAGAGVAGVVLQNSGDTRGIRINGSDLEMYDLSAGVVRQKINSSGHIINNYQPYGSVSWSGTLNRGNIIPFNIINQERVALWNTSTYRLTAPVTGYYLFTCIAKTSGTGGLDFNIQLLHNGSSVVESWAYDNSGGKAYGASLSHIRALSAGDYVQFYFNHDSASPAALQTAWASYALLG